MNRAVALRSIAVAAIAVLFAVAAPLAAADAVYHTEHLDLAPVGNAPLRSGFVQNIKADGPEIYAHEIFVLNGALPSTAYTATRNFFYLDPECDGTLVFPSDVAALSTNAAGNARADIFVTPEEAAGLAGVHGVMWTVKTSSGAVVYRTECTAVTLD